ncbi:hypothetical protein DH2020_049508 [Rehmannia glutinosa]|uniref:Glycosyltransferase n=1 Tax=Rehmannia glutinosa TaxID=99300 RepID=A0ABR0U3I8_REHGL
MGKQVAHVLVIPYPAQGHINPVLAFAKRLASNGLLVTVITTTSVTKSAKVSLCASITIDNISDGSEDVSEHETIEGYFKRFKAVVTQNLAKYIDAHKSYACPAKVVVYDSSMPWILDIAHDRGLLGASFFTQSCGVCAIYYHLRQGTIKFPYKEDSDVSLPCLPALEANDLPSFFEVIDPKHTVMNLLADQFLNLEKVLDWMKSRWPIKTIGPTFSLLNTDTNHSDNKINHMINLFEPKSEACTKWLDSRETSSVVYVSFGSIASLGKEQMEELAHGLITSNCHFLWVVRASEKDKLPINFASEKGLIIDWCHQTDVLAHPALACFMTHCGWNSTLEALSNGVPIIAVPQWVDQHTNAKFIEDVWRVGVRVRRCKNGIVGREEIAMCVEQFVSGDDKGVELKRNACRWKELANEAVQNGGTSANNIEDFVTELLWS